MATAALVAALVLGCGEAASPPRDTCETVRGGITTCQREGRCAGAAAHPDCPSSPAGATALCGYLRTSFPVRRSPCAEAAGGTLVWWSGGTLGLLCLYDETGALAGTQEGTDSPSYCRSTSGTWSWGAAIPQACIRWSDPDVCPAP